MNGSLWNNTAGTGAFLPGSGTVTLFAAPSPPGAVTIDGSNNWNILTCTTGGTTIKFQNGKTQTISNFTINSSTTLVTLITDSPGLPWFINAASASVSMAAVSWSTSTPGTIIASSSCVDNGNNTNWLFIIPIVASWTLDTDNNGRIDRIRVQLKPGSTHNGSFGGFQVRVDGYTVNGYQQVPVGTNTDVFDILLNEGSQEDTGATPTWQILTNTSLTAAGALVDHNTATVVKKYVAARGARPVITFTAAALNTTQAYVHFSDYAYGDSAGATSIGTSNFSYSGAIITAVQPVETSGIGAHAAIVTFAPPALASGDILSGSPKTISASAAGIWSKPYPTQFVYPSVGPGPYTTFSGDPGAYSNTNPDGNLPASGADAMLTAPAHNISDVGLGFVTPVFALNPTVQRDPARGGVGMVTTFDGTHWLLPEDALLEARILPAATGLDNAATSLQLFWDVNPPAVFDFNNLWIPTAASTFWAPPPAPDNGGDRAHYPGDPQARTPALATGTANGALRDYTIPAADPAIKDGAVLQFMFVLTSGAVRLPLAFQADPNNPGSARPFEYAYHSIIAQRGNVTITNNVIHPANGESAYLHYVMPKAGKVSIMVFTLSGDIVNVLANGTQNAGEYATGWDGKNRGGRIVARGIYFIRVVGPGFDEMR
ncbi:MAG: FlgD immunoglobulin-like domain containing protein, partial [Tepidisphaeraceae bacterium]